MASFNVNTNRVDPYVTCQFHIEIDGIAEAIFKECSGLEYETEVLSFEEGGVNDRVHKLPGRTKYSNLTLKKGMTQSPELWDWYSKVVKGKIERKNMSVVLYETMKGEVKRWNFESAYPIKWSGPTLKADESAISIETLEIVHEGMTLS
ncbi:MAG: phage tail protein [Chloroflexi bacterium RBG_16_48_7]|nr:MAG: phage tail protein [Chloroflexi bacterium RBG_16_48_7]